VSASVESDFISKLLYTQEWGVVDEQNITQKFFSGRNKKAFKYISDFKIKYKKIPSIKEFQKRFADIELTDEDELEESMKYYCDAVREKTKHNTLASAVSDAHELLDEFETDEAYKKITGAVRKIENDVILSDCRQINEGVEQRKKDYLKRKTTGGMIGIPTGFIPFDNATGGIKETDVVSIFANTNMGKTFKELIMANNQMNLGYKPLFITRETSPEGILRRSDAIAAKVSYDGILRGTLTPAEEKKLFKFYDRIDKNPDFKLIIEKSTGGLTNIISLTQKHDPDIVFVDGAYLMTDDADEKNWQAVLDVWRGCKNYALDYKVPFVITGQLKVKNKVSLAQIKFATAVADDSDIVIFLEQDDEMALLHHMRFVFGKLRDAAPSPPYVLNWDFKKMDYSPVYISEGSFQKPDGDEKTLKKVQKLKK
jgi:replicative DNA helicase